MKILWVKSDFLHPTTRGGQIRTLEMLRCLHQRHEIHYVCLDSGDNPEGPGRAHEYCARAYPVRHSVPPRRSLQFAGQLARGLVSLLPVSVERYRSPTMQRQIERLLATHTFDSVVCDFLFPAPNLPDISRAVLFEHNVEAVIWQRHVEHASNPLARRYLAGQSRRMEAFERSVCRLARHVVAVSEVDREAIRTRYGVENVSSIKTGVNLAYFSPPPSPPRQASLVFVGSMDWLPNIDAARYFLEEIFPHIQACMPGCTVAFVGRNPDASLLDFARQQSNVVVTGTVPDVRPWLWGATASIVPLRIGGGTRLKIFEAMAARVPVVSTTIGSEGLPVERGRHLLIEDDPVQFASRCVELLRDRDLRNRLATEAWSLVAGRFSWEAVTAQFESILAANPPDGAKSRLETACLTS